MGAGRRRKKSRWRKIWVIAAIVVLVPALAGGVVIQLRRTVPRQTVSATRLASFIVPGSSSLPWPSVGEAAVTIEGVTPVRTSGSDKPVPIASLAKMMTAMLILRDHPLNGEEEGPVLTVTAADIATYNAQLSVLGSVLPVTVGEQLSERQALEAIMIPSADNIAELLGEWDAGSVPAFVVKMNAAAHALGLTHTTYTDPSGLDQGTVSNAREQLLVASAAMSIPVLAAIVDMPNATFPIAGKVVNFNHDVGHFGVVGVKTGSDSYAQGCWAFAAARTVLGTPRAVFGVVLGIHGTSQGLIVPALAAGLALANAIPNTIRAVTVVPAGTIVGYVHAPWRKAVPIRTTRALQGVAAAGEKLAIHVTLQTPSGSSVRAGGRLGVLTTNQLKGVFDTSLVAAQSASGPSLFWRLTRT
jgi:D-alanyl-D-alanine carboxypeptidase (penicillin-binding protein 5/6)